MVNSCFKFLEYRFCMNPNVQADKFRLFRFVLFVDLTSHCSFPTKANTQEQWRSSVRKFREGAVKEFRSSLVSVRSVWTYGMLVPFVGSVRWFRSMVKRSMVSTQIHRLEKQVSYTETGLQCLTNCSNCSLSLSLSLSLFFSLYHIMHVLFQLLIFSYHASECSLWHVSYIK